MGLRILGFFGIIASMAFASMTGVIAIIIAAFVAIVVGDYGQRGANSYRRGGLLPRQLSPVPAAEAGRPFASKPSDRMPSEEQRYLDMEHAYLPGNIYHDTIYSEPDTMSSDVFDDSFDMMSDHSHY